MKIRNLFEQFNTGDKVFVKNYQGVGRIFRIIHSNEVQIIFDDNETNRQAGSSGLRVVSSIHDLTPYLENSENEIDKYEVKEIDKHDVQTLNNFCDFVNSNSGQLAWTLTPQRLINKMGTLGGIYGLYLDSNLVGGITVKQNNFKDGDKTIKAGEIGYLFVTPKNRSLKNVKMLYDASLEHAKMFDVLYGTTNVKNRPVNVLLNRTPKMKFMFTAKSPFSSNKINYWISIYSNKKYSLEEREQILKDQFADETTV